MGRISIIKCWCTRKIKLINCATTIWTVLISLIRILALYQSRLTKIANLHVIVVIILDIAQIWVRCDQFADLTLVHLCSLAVYTYASILWAIYSFTETFLDHLFNVLSQTVGTKRMTTRINFQHFALSNDYISLQAYSTVIPLLNSWLSRSSFGYSWFLLIQVSAQLNCVLLHIFHSSIFI